MTCGEKRLKDRKSEPALVVAMPPRVFDGSLTVKVCSFQCQRRKQNTQESGGLTIIICLGIGAKS